MSHFVMLRGPEPGLKINLEKEEITIGRGRRNDIIIHDNEVSREHCRLIRVLDDYELHDLGSTNGTFVNGQKIDSGAWMLSARSIVELGDSITLEYHPAEDESSVIEPVKSSRRTQRNTVVATQYLVVQRASLPNPEVYELDSSEITLGRDLDNDIVLQESEVSRNHIHISLRERGHFITDLGTLNGTQVNGERIERGHYLHKGDHIRIGTMVDMWYTNDPYNQLTISADTEPVIGQQTTDTLHHRVTNEAPKIHEESLVDYVFLAYPRADWQTISKMRDYLELHKIPVFVEQFFTPKTEEWQDAIEHAQLSCRCLIALLDDEALQVPYITRSIRHYLTREKPMILISIGEITRMPVMLANLPILEYDHSDPMRTYRVVMAELKKLSAMH